MAEDQQYTEYKVIYVVEGGCGTIILGSSGIPVKKMETELNKLSSSGWEMVFQVIERKRFLLFWTREALPKRFVPKSGSVFAILVNY